jgi:hypothetical protein
MKKDIKAEIWEIRICNSVLDMTHGWYQKIREIHIPSEEISLNIANDALNCFKTTVSLRYSHETQAILIGNIDIPSELVKEVKKYIELRDKLLLKFDRYFGKE